MRRVRADGVMAYEFGLAAGRDLLGRDAQAARTHRRRVTDRTRSPPEALSLRVVTFLFPISGLQALQVSCGIVGTEWAGRQEEGRGRRFHQDNILKTRLDNTDYSHGIWEDHVTLRTFL